MILVQTNQKVRNSKSHGTRNANLWSFALPADALLCHGVMCCKRLALNKYANDIASACVSAAEPSVPTTTRLLV